MALTTDEIREHAQRIIELHNDEYEYCLVYEDDDLLELEATDDEMLAIREAMNAARLRVDWDD